MKDFELQIEYIELDKLTPYENNAREHTPVDLATIQQSIHDFGMCDPIGIWSDKNIIVEGHGRLLALKELGHTKAPCIRLDHLTDEERRAYALAHNKTAEMSKWDFEKLENELANLPEMSMQNYGFYMAHGEDDFANLFDEPQENEAGDEDEEEAPVFRVVVELESKEAANELCEELREQGYQCEVQK